MSKQKTFKWSNVFMIAFLVVIVLIPLLMSRTGRTVDSWTEAKDMEKSFESLEALKSLEAMEALEGLPELQAEMDSIMASIEIPELDSFMFIIPDLPFREDGKKSKKITISKSIGLPSYTVPPEIIGGYDALLEHLVYPEELKKAGVEGTVIVQIHVQKDGSVDKTHLLKSSGYEQLDKAALDAAMKIDFEHVGEPADVWIALPVMFKLKR